MASTLRCAASLSSRASNRPEAAPKQAPAVPKLLRESARQGLPALLAGLAATQLLVLPPPAAASLPTSTPASLEAGSSAAAAAAANRSFGFLADAGDALTRTLQESAIPELMDKIGTAAKSSLEPREMAVTAPRGAHWNEHGHCYSRVLCGPKYAANPRAVQETAVLADMGGSGSASLIAPPLVDLPKMAGDVWAKAAATFTEVGPRSST